MAVQGSVPKPGKAPTSGVGGNVAYVRPELAAMTTQWQLIDDCLKGADAIKARKDLHLPVPDAETGGTITDARYKNYIHRAVFYNVTGRTLQGLVGQVFGRDGTMELPEAIKYMETDVAGDGVSILQQAKKTLEHVLSFGRAGLLADYPTTGGVVTKAQEQSGEVRPIIKMYRPENIINWRTKRVGAKVKLSLIVLVEKIDVNDDGFETEVATAYRVLRLNEQNQYTVQVYIDSSQGIVEHGELITPKQANGQPFDFIPFTFVGPENNDATIDAAPLYAMATLNVAHYRNSADYEDCCFIAGQPTPFFSGLTEEWVVNVMKGKVHLGSRGGIMLPKGGTAGLLQPQQNTMPKEAMEHKEHQMVALGAKLVEERSIRRTATEARQDEASETSILSSSTKNVTVAYQQCLKWAQMFTTAAGDIVFALNSDFDLSNMTPAERQQLIMEWQSEAITFTEMRTALKRTRIAYQDDDEAQAEITANPPVTVEMPEDEGDGKGNGNPVEGAGGDD
jgi:hypothetical protein